MFSEDAFRAYCNEIWGSLQIREALNAELNLTQRLVSPQSFSGRIPWGGETIYFPKRSFGDIVAGIIPGLICEFGVYIGTTLSEICEAVDTRTVYGFDSFKGIDEAWSCYHRGYWAIDDERLAGIKWPENAEIIPGWFADTLPGFFTGHPGPIAYAHINCGLYSAARDVLTNIADRIVIGTILHFGEIKNIPGCDHEQRAFNEYLTEHGGEWEVFAETNIFDAALRKLK